jgi:hypothetical protein
MRKKVPNVIESFHHNRFKRYLFDTGMLLDKFLRMDGIAHSISGISLPSDNVKGVIKPSKPTKPLS